MKHLVKISLVILVFSAISCAQKKEKREEFKDEHSVEEKRVNGTAEAAAAGETKVIDSTKTDNVQDGK